MNARGTVDSSRWIMLGTSPSAGHYYGLLDSDACRVITCNAGLSIEPDPDYYWVHDPHAVGYYKGQYAAARERGTKVISTGRSKLQKEHRDATFDDLSPRVIRSSGTMIASWLAARGDVSEVHVVGLEGYGIESTGLQQGFTYHQSCQIQKAVDGSVGTIRWAFYGDLNYKIEGVEVIND